MALSVFCTTLAEGMMGLPRRSWKDLAQVKVTVYPNKEVRVAGDRESDGVKNKLSVVGCQNGFFPGN